MWGIPQDPELRAIPSLTHGERRAGTGCRFTIMQGQNSATELGFCRNKHTLSIPLSCYSTGNTHSCWEGFPWSFLWPTLPKPPLIPFLHRLPFPTSSQHIHSFSIVLNRNLPVTGASLLLFVVNIKRLMKYNVQFIYHLNNQWVQFQPAI